MYSQKPLFHLITLVFINFLGIFLTIAAVFTTDIIPPNTAFYGILLIFLANLTSAAIACVLLFRTDKVITNTIQELPHVSIEFNAMERMLYAMEAQILITEIDTDNIIFLNRKMQKAFGITRDIRGEKCWQHFQKGIDKRCSFCPKNKPELNTDEPFLWEEHNSLTGKRYRIACRKIDWHNGTKVYFQQRDDITELTNATAKLGEHLMQQMLMRRIANAFLIEEHVESLFADTLCQVGEFMGISQILLYQLEGDEKTMICRSEWTNPELQLESRIGHTLNLQGPALAFCQNLSPNRQQDLYHCTSDPFFDAIRKPYHQHFQNCLMTPVFVQGRVRAILDFAVVDDNREWSDEEINIAVLTAGTFSGVFERNAMERQFSMVENSPNFLLYLSSNGSVEYANPASLSITGYTNNELVAGGLGIILGKQVLTDIMEKYIPKVLGGEAVHFETDLIRKDRETRILAVSIVQTGKDHLGMLTRDLTEIRELETGLTIAKERAEHSNRSKSNFLSRVSHEMLTPMNAIMGYTEVLRIQRIPDSMQEYLHEIEVASRELHHRINEILDLSGIEYGMFTLKDQVFDMDVLIRDVLHATEQRASRKRQSFSADIEPAIPFSLTGDERRLKQVFMALLANAIKFTPEQGAIHFSARILDAGDEVITLQFEITDNGIGIPKDYQSKVFDLFEQADGSLTRKHGGLGIGLALSQRFVELMGGKIWVDSELGKGSTFTFTCQLKRSEQI